MSSEEEIPDLHFSFELRKIKALEGVAFEVYPVLHFSFELRRLKSIEHR